MFVHPCFENFIGVKGDCHPPIDLVTSQPAPPTSGYYINDLESIDLSSLAKISDAEYQTGVNLAKEKIKFAINLVTEDIYNAIYLGGRYAFNDVVEACTVGVFTDEYSILTPDDKGVIIKKNCSGLTNLMLKRVTLLFGNVGGAAEIYVTDGNNVTTYNSGTAINASVPISIYPNQPLYHPTITVVSNGGIFNNSKLNNCGCPCEIGCCNDNFSIDGWDGIATSSFTYGMQVEVYAYCDFKNLLCKINHRLGLVMLYRAGMELLKERLVSNRANWITLNIEQTKWLLEQWTETYKSHLNILITQIPNLIRDYDTDGCFRCRDAKGIYICP